MQEQGAGNGVIGGPPTGSVTIRIDGYTRFCLTAIMALLTVLILALWVATPSTTPAARAADEAPANGVFNAGAQRVAAVDAANATNGKLDATNQKLDRIISLLESGQAKVTLQQAEKDRPANAEK
jgi:cell division protein FtsB